jgi:isopentenyl-diphosphate delta-isomerase
MTGEHEQVVLVDGFDTELGCAGKLEAHKRGLLHRAVSVVVGRSDGRLLLQRRAAGKYHSGGRWSNACCTHPRPGEGAGGAARRRLWEELGIDCPLAPAGSVRYLADVGGGLVEHELTHVFVGRCDDEPIPDPAEVCDWLAVEPHLLERDCLQRPSAYSAWLRPVLDAARPHLWG